MVYLPNQASSEGELQLTVSGPQREMGRPRLAVWLIAGTLAWILNVSKPPQSSELRRNRRELGF